MSARYTLQLRAQTSDPFEPPVKFIVASRKTRVRFHDPAGLTPEQVDAEVKRVAEELRWESEQPCFWEFLARALLEKGQQPS